MSTDEVFQDFYAQLVKILPMNDDVFVAELFSAKLLPGDAKAQVKSKATRACKAAYFLDHVIEPSLATTFGSFNKLLKVMENNDYNGLKELAKSIRSNLMAKPVTVETGKLICEHLC